MRAKVVKHLPSPIQAAKDKVPFIYTGARACAGVLARVLGRSRQWTSHYHCSVCNILPRCLLCPLVRAVAALIDDGGRAAQAT